NIGSGTGPFPPHGFLKSGGTYTTIDDPLATAGTAAYGINASGQIVGLYNTGALATHGFLYNPNSGTFTTLDDPLASMGTSTVPAPLPINGPGKIGGTYYHQAPHGFLNSGGNYTTIDDPLGTSTTAYGINDMGQIVGSYVDASNKTHGFLYNPNGGTF